MPYRYSTDDSDVSTIYDVTPSKEEVHNFYSFMKKKTKNLKPSRNQLVLGVSDRVNVNLLSEKIDRDHSGFFSLFRSKALVVSFDELDDVIDAKAKGKKSLVLLVTRLADEIKFDVPSTYKSLTIIRCPGRECDSPFLAIEPSSRYCKIPLPMWDVRTKHLNHNLRLESGVCLVDRFGGLSRNTSLYGSDFEASIRNQADQLRDPSTSWERRRMAVASILGGLVGGGTTALKLYTCVNITGGGVFLKCQGVKLGLGGLKALQIGSLTFKAGCVKSSLVAAAQVVGPPVLIGAAAGVAVGALVYYVPWNSLFQWLKNLLKGFWNWLVETFQALRDAVSSWFQEKDVRASHRRRSRSSRHHSMRM